MPPQNSDPKGESKPPAGPLDLDKILLPKKEAPGASAQSAARASAGALYTQEQNAELPKPEAAKPTPTTPTAPAEETLVKPIQTFQGDVERVVQQKNVSVVSMAADEAKRREKQPLNPIALVQNISVSTVKKVLMISLGVLFVASSLGFIAYAALQYAPITPEETVSAPFIAADEMAAIAFEATNLNRRFVMDELVSARDSFVLPLGLVGWLQVGIAEVVTSAEGEAEVVREAAVEEFLTALAPRVPESLTRTLEKRFVLGFYSHDGTQPFLLFKTDSYEGAFAGMLAWESSMHDELMPLFKRTLPVRPAPITSVSTTTSPVFIPIEFKDLIVENHDARVVQNEFGDTLLLWTFLDRQTVLIANSNATVREIIRRLTAAPVIPAL